ncbi:hypothetical protein N7478_009482 [Penicillium angulare]|uniref:uncharacterized protein n=1 Tax=Penicillium angulare TaxID=116970 RepID=UPI0025410E7E|nr:uncharacterized protein N7478_009482 [Penicillium angulare]KAJ5266674.1 hypothetical protein N7478_009482 [Penicillium angulare]
MAPIRRYLRITKYSVLECRIYLDNPSDSRWLLNAQDPVLPRVFEVIRPLVLPKLREENERRWFRKKGKATKDVIAEDDFEVGIFLRETRSRHSVLTRQKTFNQPGKKEDTEDSKELQGDPFESAGGEIIIQSDSDQEVDLHNIPEATEGEATSDNNKTTRRRKGKAPADETSNEDTGDEKKLGFSTHYESFSISGWVLCLLISRKDGRPKATVTPAEAKQPLMEQWISTQAQAGED